MSTRGGSVTRETKKAANLIALSAEIPELEKLQMMYGLVRNITSRTRSKAEKFEAISDIYENIRKLTMQAIAMELAKLNRKEITAERQQPGKPKETTWKQSS